MSRYTCHGLRCDRETDALSIANDFELASASVYQPPLPGPAGHWSRATLFEAWQPAQRVQL